MSFPSLMDDVTRSEMCLHDEPMPPDLGGPRTVFKVSRPNKKDKMHQTRDKHMMDASPSHPQMMKDNDSSTKQTHIKHEHNTPQYEASIKFKHAPQRVPQNITYLCKCKKNTSPCESWCVSSSRQ